MVACLPGTTLFHRRPESVSYLTGESTSSTGGLVDSLDPESNEFRSSLAVEGRCASIAARSKSWPWNGKCGSDKVVSSFLDAPLGLLSATALWNEYRRDSRRRIKAGMGRIGMREYSIRLCTSSRKIEVEADSLRVSNGGRGK